MNLGKFVIVIFGSLLMIILRRDYVLNGDRVAVQVVKCLRLRFIKRFLRYLIPFGVCGQ